MGLEGGGGSGTATEYFMEQERKAREAQLAKIDIQDIGPFVELESQAVIKPEFVDGLILDTGAVAISIAENRIFINDLSSQSAQEIEVANEYTPLAAHISPDGKVLFSHAKDNYLRKLDPETGLHEATGILIGEPTSFGFLEDSRFVCLDNVGDLRVDGKDTSLGLKRPHRLTKDEKQPFSRLEVAGNSVLLEWLEVDEVHEGDKKIPTVWILGGKPYNYDQIWYYKHQAVVSMQVNPKTIFTANVHLTTDELEGRWGVKELPTRIHNTGAITFIERGEGSFFSTGYNFDKVGFYGPDKSLWGSQRVEGGQINADSFAATPDGRSGFVGRRDGGIEVINLSDRPDAGSVQQQVKTSMETIGNTLFASIEAVGELHPEKNGPSSITFWKAHEAPVKRLFIVDNGDSEKLCSVDTEGHMKFWKINPSS